MPNPMLLQMTERGLYCAAADLYVDPWVPIPRAVITHAHADHLQPGCGSYLVARDGLLVTRVRLGDEASIQTAAYGEPITVNGVELSLHPAGHILGSAQVRLACRGEVAVVSGEGLSATCAPFEPVRCHTFVTESTFGLPIFRWAPDAETFADINAWWAANSQESRPSLLFGYALGKAQRLPAGVDPAVIAHRLMGDWAPTAAFYANLMAAESAAPALGLPYPFCLAYPIDDPAASLGPLGDWQVEWKWDGIRAQLVRRAHQTFLWSRGEELITERFPELAALAEQLPEGTVLDGEILPWKDGRVLPFAQLQRRIGRKTLSRAILSEVPVALVAFDLLEWSGQDVRGQPLSERRTRLETLLATLDDARL